MIDPISQIGNYKIHWLGIIGPTQSGKSVFLQASVADAIDQDPGPGLYILPNETTGKKHLEEKLVSMINASPELACYKTNKVKDISQEQIRLQHMTIYPAWATSIATMNSFPMKRVWLDEVRLMSLAVGQESNAIKFAGDRLTTYFEYGIGQGYMVSSPSVEGDLLHQQLSIPGTLYVTWQVPCLKCGEYQELDFFVNLKLVKGEPKCLCKYCGAEFKDDDKKKAFNAHGRYAVVEYEDNQWKPTRIETDGTLEHPFEYGVGHNRVFFHWDSMVSPFRSFQRIWNEFIQTKDKLHDYKNFYQCWLAKFWIDDKSKTTTITLKNRRKDELYKGDVPPWTKVLTAGIDTQDRGFYVVVRAWGPDKLTFVVDEFFIKCDIEIADYKEIVDAFNTNLFRREFGPLNNKWRVPLAAIDTGGHRTKQIYGAAEFLPQLIMVKGAHETQRITIQYSKDYNLYLVRTSEYLEETDTRSQQENFLLPCDVSKDFLAQYCAIRKTENQNKKTGEVKTVWKKIGQNDFRMADVHAFIVLDIPTEKGTLRHQLDIPDFKLNPVAEERKLREARLSQPKRIQESTHFNDYEIGEFNW